MTDFAKELGNEQNEIIEKSVLDMKSYEVFDADIRVAIDSQVATAHAYPRNLKKVLENILFLATQDKETAENCFYSVKRDGKTIRGASIRLAEIITACYGNIRASSRIVSNDGKMVTAQGMCWDLENNVAFSVEVKRRITDKYGRTFSDDLVVITNNACSSIALRNAIFKVVPMAITSRIQSEIKKIVLGETKDFETTRKNAVEYFINLGVTEKNILDLFAKKTVQDLDRDDIFDLRGIATAINEGDTTLESAFMIAPKGNTAISKATKILSVPIEQGEAEYEKTNTPQLNKADKKNEIKGVDIQPSSKPNSEFTNINGEKEVVFGENTESKEENKEAFKIEINSVTDEKGNELSSSLYGNIKKEDLVKSEEKPAIVLIKEIDKEVDKSDKEFTIEPFVSNEPVVSTPVVTDKEPIREVKKKYKKYKKKEDKTDDSNKNENLFDQNNN